MGVLANNQKPKASQKEVADQLIYWYVDYLKGFVNPREDSELSPSCFAALLLGPLRSLWITAAQAPSITRMLMVMAL